MSVYEYVDGDSYARRDGRHGPVATGVLGASGVFDIICYESLWCRSRVPYAQGKVGRCVDPVRLQGQCFFGAGNVDARIPRIWT